MEKELLNKEVIKNVITADYKRLSEKYMEKISDGDHNAAAYHKGGMIELEHLIVELRIQGVID